MARRFIRSVRTTGPRRKTIWGSTDLPNTALAAGTKVLLASFTAAQLQTVGVPLTVIRERGLLHVESDQSATDELVEGAFGICKVTDVARIAGAASIPGPISDADWDGWYVWQPFLMRYEFASGVGFQAGGAGMTYVIDSKAMRKFSSEDSSVIIAENASSVHGALVAFQGRTLFKLH